MKYKFIYTSLSTFMVLISLLSLISWGLNLSIDFTGGSLLELNMESSLGKEEQKDFLSQKFSEKGIQLYSLQESNDNSFIIRTTALEETAKNEFMSFLNENENFHVSERRFELVGPTIGKEVTRKTFVAVGFAIAAILIYIAWVSRKTASHIASYKFGVAAIIAMLHDSFILLGMASILGHFFHMEIDLLFITAVMTIMSFSVHDTIVVFDRIQETFRKEPQMELETAINLSLKETMTRSVNNSMTIIFMLLTLLLLGGQTIFYFVLTLLVGTILGTYSSPFVATPFLVAWEKLSSRVKKKS